MSLNRKMLNYHTYIFVKEQVKDFKVKDFDWDEISYDVFTNQTFDDQNDLIKLIAYAYSWMPTMAKFKSALVHESEFIVEGIKKFRNMTGLTSFQENENEIGLLTDKLVNIINNSIVGTSKVLHFTNCSFFPILDSKVVDGWRKLFSDKYECQSAGIVWLSKNTLFEKDKFSVTYLQYSKNMLTWLSSINLVDKEVTLRDLEVMLYKLGKSNLN